MAIITKSLSLDVSRPNRIQAIVAKQYDKNSRFLKIQLADEGELILVDQASVVTINATRADNKSKPFVGEVNDDGTVTVPITYWMLELDDKVSCDVSIVDNQDRKLSTLNFTIDVERSNTSMDNIEDEYDESEYDLLIQVLSNEERRQARFEEMMAHDLTPRVTALEEAVADLNYKAIAISSFGVTPSTTEMGSTVNSVALSWAVNKTPTTLTLDGATIDTTETKKTITGTFTSNKTWTLTATDERGATATKSATLSFLNGVYYGALEEPLIYDSEFVLRLTKNLRSSKLTSFSVNAGIDEYIYYCLPKRMGTCAFNVGGFDGGFSLVDTISFTNASGYTEDYYIYRSVNSSLGQTTVTVS